MAQAVSVLGETFDRSNRLAGGRFGHCVHTGPEAAMEAFLVSVTLVALAEMGDKTQLLSLVLAARYRRPWPIVLGILVATLANHALAGALGNWLTATLGPQMLRVIVGIGFLAMAVWALVPDKLDGAPVAKAGLGVFATTCVAFFIAEMGDKTQVATVALAARYASFAPVVLGTTIGMLLANVPVVFLGERLAARLPMRLLQRVAAALFAVLGIWALVA
jgi:putative Ca2+/H+ antiporter (TMEM165/GDT1 family)